MKDTGITQRIDQLRQISLPVELRRNMKMTVGDLMEFFAKDSIIIVREYEENYVFSDRRENSMKVFHGKKVCPACLRDFREEIGTDEPAPAVDFR